MRIYISLLISLLLVLVSCKDNSKELHENQIRLQKHNDSVFKVLNERWNFRLPATSKAVSDEIKEWKQWSEFADELKLKPVTSIAAFQKKTEKLNSVLSVLPTTLPSELDLPEVKARLTVLINTFNFMDMYLRIDPVPIDEINRLLPQVNKQITSVTQKMDEIMVKKSIPKEIGEEEMLRALDTLRHANPNLPTQVIIQNKSTLKATPILQARPALRAKHLLKAEPALQEIK